MQQTLHFDSSHLVAWQARNLGTMRMRAGLRFTKSMWQIQTASQMLSRLVEDGNVLEHHGRYKRSISTFILFVHSCLINLAPCSDGVVQVLSWFLRRRLRYTILLHPADIYNLSEHIFAQGLTGRSWMCLELTRLPPASSIMLASYPILYRSHSGHSNTKNSDGCCLKLQWRRLFAKGCFDWEKVDIQIVHANNKMLDYPFVARHRGSQTSCTLTIQPKGYK